MKIIDKLLSSFDNDTVGSSARKLSGFFAVMISGTITMLKVSEINVENLTIIWLTFAAICLGMITIQQVIEFKNGGKKHAE